LKEVTEVEGRNTEKKARELSEDEFQENKREDKYRFM
jgi:hypothetical protein